MLVRAPELVGAEIDGWTLRLGDGLAALPREAESIGRLP
jgi:hypothetical protein